MKDLEFEEEMERRRKENRINGEIKKHEDSITRLKELDKVFGSRNKIKRQKRISYHNMSIELVKENAHIENCNTACDCFINCEITGTPKSIK